VALLSRAAVCLRASDGHAEGSRR